MADISVIQTPDGTSYNIKDATARTVMTGATSENNGAAGLVPAPTTADVSKFLQGDGTWADGGKPMVILSYGNSTWQDFINAYNNNVIVYCRASSNSNPASGAQTRMAFMAYVNAAPPTSVEFQYYRSVSSHTESQQGDQVFIYKLESANGGKWTVTTREASSKIVAGTNLTSSYSSGALTISGNYSAFTGATASADGATGLVPQPQTGDEEKYLRGDGTWHTVSGGGTGDGDVTGPDSSTDGNVALFDGTTGKVIKDSGKTLGVSVPADAVFTDTTYESKSAASGGTDVSLVTTGEKYTWNNKANDADVVHITGNEAVSGEKTFSDYILFKNLIRVQNSATTASISFRGIDLDVTSAAIYCNSVQASYDGTPGMGASRLYCRCYSPTENGAPTSYYENYYLPRVDVGRESNKTYYIYTTKNVKAGNNVSISVDSSTEDITISATDTTYTAGTGITLSGTTFKMVKADVCDALNLLSTGSTDATADTYLVGCYDSTTNTDFTRRKASTVINHTLVKAALGDDWRPVALSGTVKLSQTTGTTMNFVPGSNMSITYSSGGNFTFTPDLSGCATSDHTHNTLTMNRTSTGNWLNLQGNSTQVGRLYWGTAGAAGTEGFSILQLGNATAKTAANNASGQVRLYNSNGGYARMTGTYGTLGGSSEDYINVPEQFKAAKVWGAVWNDYAEMRKCKTIEAGRCVTETISGEMELTEGRLQAGCKIISDTYGFCIGETAEAKTPIAVCGRVLAYPYKDPSGYHLGDAVCSAPNGTVDIMTREEIKEYPERIVGTISEIPKYDTWVAGSEDNHTTVKVNGRIWVYVR